MLEFGRIDIITEVNITTSVITMLREGHLENLFYSFVYLKIRHNSRIVFDSIYLMIDMSHFKEYD